MKTFKELLNDAIGSNRTQSQFAADIGVSRQTISKMLQDGYSGTPSEATLEKIADHSTGNVTVRMLKTALGLPVSEESDEHKDFFKLPYSRRNNIMAEEMRDGIRTLATRTRFDSLQDFLNLVIMLYARFDMSFRFDDTKDTDETSRSQHNGAEKYVNTYIEWEDDDCKVCYGVTFFVCETTGGGVFITDVAFDEKTLYSCGHKLAKAIKDHIYSEEDGYDVDECSLVYMTTVKTKKDMTAEMYDDIVRKSINSLYAVANNEEKEILDSLCKRAAKRSCNGNE